MTNFIFLFILILKSSLWQVGVPVYTAGTDVKPSQIAKEGLEEAKKKNIDVVIVDTAGRLQVYIYLCNGITVSFTPYIDLVCYLFSFLK